MDEFEQVPVTVQGVDWKKTALFRIKQSDSLARLKCALEESGCTGLQAGDMSLAFRGRPPLSDERSTADFVWSPSYNRESLVPYVSLVRRCRGSSVEQQGEFVIYVTGFATDTWFFPVFVTGSHLVSSLKKYLQQLRRVEDTVLYQVKEGRVLEDGATLSECGVKPESALSLLPVPDGGGGPFEITVRHYEGRQLAVNVLASETVGHLNLRLWLKGFIAWAPEKQWAKFGERRLESWEILQDCNVGPNCMLDLIPIRLRGPPNLPASAYLRGLEIRVDVDSVMSVPTDTKAEGKQRDSQPSADVKNRACEICHLKEDASNWQVMNPQIVAECGTRFSIALPGKGRYQCSVTGLRWKTKAAATVEYRYRSWHHCVPDLTARGWSPAGPLFFITATNGVITSVQIPHFLCLKGARPTNDIRIFRMTDENYALQASSQVLPAYASLSRAKCSATGLVQPVKKLCPVHGVVLVYRTLSADGTLHVYLIANDHSVEQAVHSQELRSVRINKSWTTRPLDSEETYSLISSSSAVTTPANIQFQYQSFGQEQSFCKVRTKDGSSNVDLCFITQNQDCVWRCLLKPGDIKVSHMVETPIWVVDLANVPPDPKLPGDPL